MLLIGLAAAVVVIILDQVSKLAILHSSAGEIGWRRTVLPIFDLTLTFNHGITFGLFNNGATANALIFSGLALAIVAVLVVVLTRATAWHNALALGMVIGGALGCDSTASSTSSISIWATIISISLTSAIRRFASASA